MKIDILKKEDVTVLLQNHISNLFEQLSPGKEQEKLNQIFEVNNQITIAYCQQKQKVVGIALMCNYSVISGRKGWIEDVVVDNNVRGNGIGKKLIEKLLEEAEKRKLSEVLLFTEDHRTPAINLYKKMGFKLKNSRIYILKMRKANKLDI